MTTVKDLIKYLKTLPEETECSVIVTCSGNWSIYTKEADMDLREYEGNIEYIDFTSNPFTKKDAAHYNKKYLTFGTL